MPKYVPFNVRVDERWLKRLNRYVRRAHSDMHGAQSHVVRELLDSGLARLERKLERERKR